jgi:hypothetical protein
MDTRTHVLATSSVCLQVFLYTRHPKRYSMKPATWISEITNPAGSATLFVKAGGLYILNKFQNDGEIDVV